MTVSKTSSRTESRQLGQQASRGNITSLQRFLIALCDGVLTLGGVTLDAHTVANAPAAAQHTGRQIYVSDGAGGSPVMAFSDGTNWLRMDTRAAIAAS